MHTKAVSALVREIARAPSGRMALKDFQASYLHACPEDRNAPDLRRRIAEAAQLLSESGTVVLPSSAKSWDRLGSVPLPLHLRIPPRPGLPRAGRPSVSWVPLLSWASEVTDPRRLEMLTAVNAFLIGCGGHPVPVPEKERSLEIFGDEKRISSNLRDGKFLGVVDLADIGAVRMHTPLPCVVPPVSVSGALPILGAPLLVVENEDSYHSLGRWNATSRRYAGVAYASGNAFRKTAAGLDDLVVSTGAGEIHYLGDVDRDGLEIPAAVDAARRAAGMTSLLPATDFYRWLLRHGSPLPGATSRPLSPDAIAWFSSELVAEVVTVLEAGKRIPQEYLGTLVLARDFGCQF